MTNLADKKWIAVFVVAAATVIAQFPAVDHWIIEQTKEHSHIVTLVEGIIGIILLFYATFRPAGGTP